MYMLDFLKYLRRVLFVLGITHQTQMILRRISSILLPRFNNRLTTVSKDFSPILILWENRCSQICTEHFYD